MIYPKSRRLDNGLFWLTDCEPDSEPILVKAIDMAVLFAIIIGLVCLLAWAQGRDYDDQVLLHQERAALSQAAADRYALMLGECMLGRTLWDKQNEVAYFCSKPLEVKKP